MQQFRVHDYINNLALWPLLLTNFTLLVELKTLPLLQLTSTERSASKSANQDFLFDTLNKCTQLTKEITASLQI